MKRGGVGSEGDCAGLATAVSGPADGGEDICGCVLLGVHGFATTGWLETSWFVSDDEV